MVQILRTTRSGRSLFAAALVFVRGSDGFRMLGGNTADVPMIAVNAAVNGGEVNPGEDNSSDHSDVPMNGEDDRSGGDSESGDDEKEWDFGTPRDIRESEDGFSDYEKNSQKLLCGGLTGVTSVSITYPTDLVRRRMQLQGFDVSVPVYNSVNDCIKKIWKNEGIKGFYRGLVATYIKIFPTIAIQFWALETCQDLLK